jgi:SNF2 family DNA or RNA helicase
MADEPIAKEGSEQPDNEIQNNITQTTLGEIVIAQTPCLNTIVDFQSLDAIIQLQKSLPPLTFDPDCTPKNFITYFANINAFKLEFDLDDSLLKFVKTIPTREYNSQEKCWYVQANTSVISSISLLIHHYHFIAYEAALNMIFQLYFHAIENKQDITLPLLESVKGNVELLNGKIAVRFHYDQTLVELMRSLNGKWHADTKSWLFALTSAQEVVAALPDFYISPAVSKSIDAQHQAIEASQAAYASLEITGLGGELRPFQKAGVAYALWAKQCFIADEPGLGKTIQALAIIHAAQAYPALIVCPASLKLNWQKEALHWLPDKKVTLIQGTSPQELLGDLLIINYDILIAHQDAFQHHNLKAIVLDESHAVKNYRAQRTKAAKEIAKNIEIRLCLTGTPVLNRPQELISQLQVLDRLDDIGGFNLFINQYCKATETKYGLDISGADNLEELNEKLRATCYIRRKKADVLSELPEKQRAVIPVEISNRKEYKRAEKDLTAWLREQVAKDVKFLMSIKHLSAKEQQNQKKKRADSAEEKAKRALQLVKVEALKQITAKGKLAAVEEWIESFLETGEKLVVFAYHIEIVQLLAKKFNAPSITGNTKLAVRQANVEKFQTDRETKLIILNLQAGGVGLTLTAASNVAFIELGWTPAVMDQATDRTHRIGQQNQVTAWYLLGVDTIDEQIDTLIECKRKVVNATTDGNLAIQDVSIINELIEHLLKK